MYKHSISGSVKKLLLVAVIMLFLPISVYADTAPSFYVHRNNVDQTVTTNVITLINFTTASFNYASQFDLTTDRFTPLFSGRYVLSASATCGGTGTLRCQITIAKNGSPIANNVQIDYSGTNSDASVAIVADANGSTDYFEAYVTNFGGTTINGTSYNTNFSGSMLTTYTPLNIQASTASSTVSDPNRDFYNGIIIFLIMFFGIIWIFSRKR